MISELHQTSTVRLDPGGSVIAEYMTRKALLCHTILRYSPLDARTYHSSPPLGKPSKETTRDIEEEQEEKDHTKGVSDELSYNQTRVRHRQFPDSVAVVPSAQSCVAFSRQAAGVNPLPTFPATIRHRSFSYSCIARSSRWVCNVQSVCQSS